MPEKCGCEKVGGAPEQSLVIWSVWHTTFGWRGSDTSTAVKFFAALARLNLIRQAV